MLFTLLRCLTIYDLIKKKLSDSLTMDKENSETKATKEKYDDFKKKMALKRVATTKAGGK